MTAAALLDDAPAPPDAEALDRIKARLINPLPTDRLRGWLLPLAVMVLGGVARFWRISRPGGHSLTSKNELVFDEVYYAHDSWTLLHHGVEGNADGTGAGFVVHPPLGKWLMALGELLLDHGKQFVATSKASDGTISHTIYPASPLSFRFAGCVVGTLAILIVARLARRMFHSTALGVIAGSLVALDGLEFVQSRTAMLDIFLMFWMLAAFACLVVDRDDGRRRLAERLTAPIDRYEWGPSIGFRKWRWAAGLCLGIACGTKWDGAYFIPAFIALAVAWDVGARRTAGSRDGLWAGAVFSLGPAALAFIALPAAIYVASWTGWFLSNAQYAYYHDRYTHPGQSWFAHDKAVLHGWWYYQQQIWNYDKTLDKPHPYLSKPLGWILLIRPVAYYYQSQSGCGASSCSQEVLGLGNPIIWWASIPALLAVTWAWLARRDWRAATILVAFLFAWVPWVVEEMHTVSGCTPAADCHRTMFMFYMLPDVPFMALAITMAIGYVVGHESTATVRRTIRISTVGAYLVAVIVVFGYFYPILTAKNISYGEWHNRMWLRTCQSHPNTHLENAPCWI